MRPALLRSRQSASCFVFLLLSGLVACKTSVNTDVKPPIVHSQFGDLPSEREALLELSDTDSAKGPEGPDLVRSLRAAEAVLKDDPDDAEALWRAARAIYLSTLLEPTDDTDTKKTTERCMQFGALATKNATSARAHFYNALCMGARAQAVKVEGLDLVKKMVKEGEAAVAINPNAEHGGAHRLLGGIYLRAPAWPTSVGDGEAAVEHLEKAVEIAPNWPENHIMLAEAYIEEDRPDDAKIALEAAKKLLARPEVEGWRQRFSTQLDALAAKLRP